MLIFIPSLKQTHKTQYCVFKLSTKSMNDESKNVTRQSPIFCCWGRSYWSLLRWKFPFHCVCTSAKGVGRNLFRERGGGLHFFSPLNSLPPPRPIPLPSLFPLPPFSCPPLSPSFLPYPFPCCKGVRGFNPRNFFVFLHCCRWVLTDFR